MALDHKKGLIEFNYQPSLINFINLIKHISMPNHCHVLSAGMFSKLSDDFSILFFTSLFYWTFYHLCNIEYGHRSNFDINSDWLNECQAETKITSMRQFGKLSKLRKILFVLLLRRTLYNAILRIARNFLENRENIKILTHPFYRINLGWFSWEWSKKKFFFSKKKPFFFASFS